MDFLWHSVSENEKEDIKKQAKGIMDSFSKKLNSVKEKMPEPFVERKEFEREESPASVSPSARPEESKEKEEFRKIMFENAPNKSGDFIVAEKKSWK